MCNIVCASTNNISKHNYYTRKYIYIYINLHVAQKNNSHSPVNSLNFIMLFFEQVYDFEWTFS